MFILSLDRPLQFRRLLDGVLGGYTGCVVCVLNNIYTEDHVTTSKTGTQGPCLTRSRCDLTACGL